MKKIAVKALILTFALCFTVLVGGAVDADASTTNPAWECEYGPTHSLGSSGGQYVGWRHEGCTHHHIHNGKSCFYEERVELLKRRCPCGYEVVVDGAHYEVHSIY